MADRWQAKLSRPIIMRDGTKLETLAEAGAFLHCPKAIKFAEAGRSGVVETPEQP
jgi:hypothetical protein